MSVKKSISLMLIFSSICLTAFTAKYVQSWMISEEYVIKFSMKGASGTFGQLKGAINFDKDQLEEASLDVSVSASSISTGNKTKDKHARGKNWLAVEKYPLIRIQSNQFRKSAEGYSSVARLTLHGVTKELVIPFTFSGSEDIGLFESVFTINRSDFGIEGPLLSFMVGDEVEVHLKVPVAAQ